MAATEQKPAVEPQPQAATGPIELPQSIFFSEKGGHLPGEQPELKNKAFWAFLRRVFG